MCVSVCLLAKLAAAQTKELIQLHLCGSLDEHGREGSWKSPLVSTLPISQLADLKQEDGHSKAWRRLLASMLGGFAWVSCILSLLVAPIILKTTSSPSITSIFAAFGFFQRVFFVLFAVHLWSCTTHTLNGLSCCSPCSSARNQQINMMPESEVW